MTKTRSARRRLPSRAEVSAKLPAASELISRAELCARIVCRLEGSQNPSRAGKNKVSHQISYAVKWGPLVEAKPNQFIFGKASRWVRSTWPGRFDDFPNPPGAGRGKLKLPGLQVSGTGSSLPTTLAECQAEIADARAHILNLEAQLGENITRLRRFEERARLRALRASEAGKSGGRGKVKYLGRKP